MELRVRNVVKKYGTKKAVNGFDTKLKPGIYGLLGANGSGKTTLMRLICNILRPTGGTIYCNGKTIVEMGESYRELLGYLPQEFGCYPDFTVQNYMLYIASLKGMNGHIAKKSTNELLEKVGLNEERKTATRKLSGGMKQRLGIAQAMLNNPKILILDEPTVGLDPKERVKFRNLISSFAKDEDRIIILSTHIVTDVEYIADEILIMKQGELWNRGTLENILKDLADQVWEIKTSMQEIINLEQHCIISNLKHEENLVIVRAISKKKPCSTAINVAPSLEDLYLYYFREE